MTTINVELPDKLYTSLKRMMADAECRTWIEFFQKITSKEIDIRFEILTVDGKKPQNHVIDFKLGDYIYRYNKGDISSLSSSNPQQITIAIVSPKD